MSYSNTLCWVDIPVLSLDRAIAFYSVLFGSEVKKIVEQGFEFGLLPHVENNVSGCLCEMPDRKPSQQGPLIYLNAEGRLDAAIEAAVRHGGTLLRPREPIGPYGHRAVILDCEGNSIALYSKNL